MTGRIHSLQSLGTVDGPGIRFVVFMQGCNLRCGCCHNPDTWAMQGGTEYTPEEIIEKVLRCKSYFGKEGGITVSGGEPILQAEFVAELFSLCHQNGINTCLDTSGSILNDNVKELLKHTDRVLLDVKQTTEDGYKKYVGGSLKTTVAFLDYLNTQGIKTTLRQVIIPTLNDNRENITRLKEIINTHPCIDKCELLPFKKICKVKYDSMGMPFPFEKYPTPTKEQMQELENMLK